MKGRARNGGPRSSGPGSGGAERKRATILIVDDEPEILRTLAGLLEDEGFSVLTEASAEEALCTVKEKHVDLALLDVYLPGMTGLDFLKRLRPDFPELSVIVMTGQGSYEAAFTAMKLGAYDFFEKPLSPERLIVSINNALRAARIKAHRDELLRVERDDFTMIGESAPMRKLSEEIGRVAPAEGKVLITGENGSGKELVARAIHEKSPRKDFPFVKLNCAAIPKDLVESELFGFEKGAFTGAMAAKRGTLELADGGTLFLDEVADMSLEAQAKFLRAAEFNEFERVGGTKTIKFDVRIIAASNKNLKEEMRKGTFREDLFHRLNVLPIEVPPLRERSSDIPLLAPHFLRKASLDNAREEKTLSQGALELLSEYSWPGNVRQLKNLMERIVIMSDSATLSREELLALCPDLSEPAGGAQGAARGAAQGAEGYADRTVHRPNLSASGPARGPAPWVPSDLPAAKGAGHLAAGADLKTTLSQAEEAAIRHALRQSSWNVTDAARRLGIDRVTLHKKMKRLGIEKKVLDE
ncbi:MAG: sigma-54 dependent transcriptional regulator [Candidatus Eisenbacteria bacterium]